MIKCNICARYMSKLGKPASARNTTSDILIYVLKTGKMSGMLYAAIQGIIEALSNDDLNLAFNLSACKSYIVSEINESDTTHAFQEDSEFNEKKFGNSLYGSLDDLNHQLAAKLNAIPAGAYIVTGSNKGLTFKSGMKEISGSHPVIQRIREEHQAILEEVNKHKFIPDEKNHQTAEGETGVLKRKIRWQENL